MPRRPSVSKDQVKSHPALAGGHVVLMSAENPAFPEAATFQGHAAMQQALENQGLTYEPTRGRYGSPEQSFIVHVDDPSHVEAALGLAKRFGQEAVVYSSGGKHQLVWVNGPQEGLATTPSEGYDFQDAEPEDNYTMVPGPNGEPHGFFSVHLNMDDQPKPFAGPVGAPQAAQAVVKAAVEAYHDILLGLRLREMAKSDEKAAARGPMVHTFKTTARAYDASQTSDDIKSGDILHVPSEGVTGILMDAWPVAIAHGEQGTGEFHALDPNGTAKGRWEAVDGGKWMPSVELAQKVHRGEHPAPAPGLNDTVAGVWQEREALKSETPMKLDDLIKSQAAKAPKANGGTIQVGKAEVNISAGNKKASGGRIVKTSIWKKSEVVSAPKANGGAITTAKSEVVSAPKANGGKVTLGKQEFVIDLANASDQEKRIKDKNPVKEAKGFEKPKSQDRAGEDKASGGNISGNKPRDPKDQKNGADDLQGEQSAPGGKQDAATSVKGKGDAKGGGTDIYDSVKGKRDPAKSPVIKAEESGERSSPSDDDEGVKECPACGGEGQFAGRLGSRAHHNCRNCGMWFSHDPSKSTQKAEGMATPKAPGAAGGGAPKLSGGSSGSSPARPVQPPLPSHAKAEDISALPASPSAGPAGNTAIINTGMGKSEAQTLILQTLAKAGGGLFAPPPTAYSQHKGNLELDTGSKGHTYGVSADPSGIAPPGGAPPKAPGAPPAAPTGLKPPAGLTGGRMRTSTSPLVAAMKDKEQATGTAMLGDPEAKFREEARALAAKVDPAKVKDTAMRHDVKLTQTAAAKSPGKPFLGRSEIPAAPKANGGAISKGKAVKKDEAEGEMCKSCGKSKLKKMCKCGA